MDASGKSDDELRKAFIDLFSDKQKQLRFLFAIDHTPTLRKLGRKFESSGKTGLAAMLYATWVEHMLNGLIAVSVNRRGWSDERARQIIRDSSIHAKLRWLMPVLGHPEIPEAHVAKLAKLADLRNQFIHYKWTYSDVSEGGRSSEVDAVFLEGCRPSLTYLARYSTRVRLPVSRAKVKRIAGHDSAS